MALLVANISDMEIAAFDKWDVPKFAQIAQDLQRFIVMPEWLKRGNVKFVTGKKITETMMDSTLGVAEHAGLHEADHVQIGDHLFERSIPWVHAKVHYGWERREVLMNRGKALRVNILAPRRAAALIDMAKDLDTKMFGAAPGVNDSTLPYNINYWLVANTAAGFNGGLVSGHTTCAGVNLTTHPNFKNYTATYADYDDDNMLEAMRIGHMETGWVSPVTEKDMYQGFGQRYRYYCAKTVYLKFQRLARHQNDNLGMDLDPIKNPLFNRHRIQWVPYLDDNEVQTGIIYQTDLKAFRLLVLTGDYLEQTGPQQVSGYHNDRVVFIDLTYAVDCMDRRSNAVYYYA